MPRSPARPASTRLPSTQALRALEAFARHGSMWQAANELALTRSAVSHQLRLLERELGFDLLQRAGKGVALTPRGSRYVASVRRALTMIGDAAALPDDRRIAGGFVVSCTPGFAAPWLCSHIGEFLERYPEVALRVRTPRQLDETANPEVDVFIAFGDGDWPGRSVELLSEVEFAPLCSPALLNKAGGFLEPRDLLKAPLLHLGDHKDWARWLALAGVEPPDEAAGIVFSDINLVLAAAAAGQGVAMGDELTCARALAAGSLIRPFELTIGSAAAYYLVTERRKAAAPVNRAFRRWLLGSMMEAGRVTPRR